jgi:heterodisulfide reductase subunit A
MTREAQTILVVGGGIAGTAAALHITGAGHRVLLIDEAPTLGGALILLDKTFPTDSCGVCFMAPDPPAICPFLECERDPAVEIRPLTRLSALEGEPGTFRATLDTAPRHVDASRCTACGLCVDVCPETAGTGWLSSSWLGECHKAIYQPFPQAVPPTFVIDPVACTRCGRCVEVCPHDAIDLSAQPASEVVEVAAVILTPGFGPNNARVRGAYGYGEYPNVITSLEYERMLSTSSPSRGLPVRPSDGQPAQRIAIVHCVGSRDRLLGVPYCSSGCCMIAAKHASLTKRRAPAAEVAVFTMDVRAAGRTYERYLAGVKSQKGVTYRRSLVSGVKLDPTTQRLLLQYAENGRSLTEPFDLVVLEVGMIVPAGVREMAERIGIQLNEYGFAATVPHVPTATSRPGVFVAGAFREPKDVPATAAEATAAAAQALTLIGGPRTIEPAPEGQKVVTRSLYDQPRVGVFFDTSDQEMMQSLDITSLAEQAGYLADVVHVGLSVEEESLHAAVAEHHLSQVIIGGRSARRNGHYPAYIAGVPVTTVALGAADAFAHLIWPALANQKALELLGMAVEQARWAVPLPVHVQKPEPRALVLGGGVAGLMAASTLSGLGFPTHLVERHDRLGGKWEGGLPDWLSDLVARVETDPLITVHLHSSITAFQRRPGHLITTLNTPEGECSIVHGALVVATGAAHHEPAGFGVNDSGIVLQPNLSRCISRWKTEGGVPSSIVMIQCAGTRDADHPYCSKTCCADALRNAVTVKQIAPQTHVAIVFRDIVTPGFSEELYSEARRHGVLFLRYTPDKPPRVEGQKVVVHDDVLDEDITLDANLLVLSSGIVPHPDTPELARMLNVPLDEDGFFRPVNVKSQLMDLPYPGLYLAGLAGGPATLEESIEQGAGAGLRAALFLRRGLQSPTMLATVDERICSGCGLCVEVCPVDARTLDIERGVAQVDPLLCVGCGTCAATCPNGAAGQALYEARGILNMLDAALG